MLPAAARSVSATSGAAQQTPAAGGYEALLGDGASVITTFETSVESLSRCLTTAGANYARADSSAAVCLAPGR